MKISPSHHHSSFWSARIAKILLLLAPLTLPQWANAQEATAPPPFGLGSLVEHMANIAGFNVVGQDQNSFVLMLGLIAFAALSLLGVIFTTLIVFGGYRWMLARGDESKITEAKGVIRHALIGLAITLAAYSVWRVIAAIL